MNVAKTSKEIITSIEDVEFEKKLEETNRIIWTEMTDLLRNTYLMRKFQKQYFKFKDKRSLETAKKYENTVDDILLDMENQKKEPTLNF